MIASLFGFKSEVQKMKQPSGRTQTIVKPQNKTGIESQLKQELDENSLLPEASTWTYSGKTPGHPVDKTVDVPKTATGSSDILEDQAKVISELLSTLKSKDKAIQQLQNRIEGLQEIQGHYNSLMYRYKGQRTQIEQLGSDLADTEKKYKGQKTRNDQLDGILLGAEQRLRDSDDELGSTKRELEACKADLFRLQPSAQVPDSCVAEDFEQVNQSIIDWVEEEISDFEERIPDAKPEQCFMACRSTRSAYWLEQYPDVGEYLIRFMIHQRLKCEMFDRSVYLLGLPRNAIEALQKAEWGMTSLQPPRDDVTVGAWRSETLRALEATEECAAEREQQIQIITCHIFDTVAPFFPIVNLDQPKSKLRLHNTVIRPAAAFASRIHISANEYIVSMPQDPFNPYKPLTVEMLKHYKIVEVKTRRILTPGNVPVGDKSQPIGEFIMDVEPFLYRPRKGDESLILRQPTRLVRLDPAFKK